MLNKQTDRIGMMNKNELDYVAALWAFFYRKSALEDKQDFTAMFFKE